jgi:type I restriction enzyme S subunit
MIPSECPNLPFIGMEHIEAHTMKLLGTAPAGSMRSAANRFYPGDVLYGRLRPYLNKVYKPSCTGLCSAEFIVFPKNEGIVPDFLRYRLNAYDFVKFASHLNAGDRPRVDFDQISSFEFFLPSYLAQQRIVAEIEKQFSRLDEAVANLKRVKANLKRYKAAVLKAAVEGMLTEEWRKQHPDVEPADKLLERILVERRKAGKGKYKEPVGPATSGLPELPAGWVWASLQTLVHQLGDGLHGTPSYTNGTTCYFVNGNNLQNGKIEIKPGTKTVSFEEMRKYKKILTPQTVLVSINGTLGNVAFYNGEEVILGKSACYFNLSSLVSKHYIRILIESPYFYTYSNVNATGSTIKNLSLKAMNELPVSLPPLAEQHQIVAEVERRFSIVAEAEAQVDANLRRADRLRQSILKQAFSGQLVPQDSNDEPAGVLLERIRHGVGAIHESPARAMRKPKRAIHESPLRNPPQPAEPKTVASTDFACVDDVTAAILACMQPGREYARAEIADALGLSAGRWNAAIQELKRVGKVRQAGEKRGARYILLKERT